VGVNHSLVFGAQHVVHDQTRENRVAGLAPSPGWRLGSGSGRPSAWRGPLGYVPPSSSAVSLPRSAPLIGSNGPMAVLGVTDPRTWALNDWVADVIPHLAYGVVTVGVLQGLDGG